MTFHIQLTDDELPDLKRILDASFHIEKFPQWARDLSTLVDAKVESLKAYAEAEKTTVALASVEDLRKELAGEIERVTAIQVEYAKIPSGGMAATFMGLSINGARAAIGTDDHRKLIHAIEDLRTYTL